jgi:hypothetical protein
MTAKDVIKELNRHQSDAELEKIKRYFKTEEGDYGHGDKFIGIRMGKIFSIAKKHGDLPILEIEKLLESPVHEYRVAGVSFSISTPLLFRTHSFATPSKI